MVVDAGALGDMEAAMEKAKALRAMLCSELPSKVRLPNRLDCTKHMFRPSRAVELLFTYR